MGDKDDTRAVDGSPPEGGESAGASPQLLELLAEVARAPDGEVRLAWSRGPRPGDVVGRFQLLRELGRGGFGVVFEAHDRELGRSVGFKAIRPGSRFADRSEEWLRREAEAVARLNHPNIVTLHDLGSAPSGPYLIFELLRGETLAERMRAGAAPAREALRLAVEVARALAHAHAAGVIHRDLKPANVFLCEDGAVKVLDFGLAHLFGRGGPSSAGTPAYMAPEQWRHEPGDERTDLFSLGTVLHELLSGQRPYRVTRERSEALDPGPPPALDAQLAPARLRRLVQAMLEKDPARRPPSAQVVLDEMLEIGRALDRPGKLRRTLALAALAAAAAGGAAWLSTRQAEPGPERTVVAVADFDNDTGDRDLDGLAGLLITSLEQSRRLQVLTRTRLFDLVRQLGIAGADRIDERVGREAGRIGGAQALLLGSVHAFGGRYLLELRALEPGGDRYLFSARAEAAGKEELPDALDKLSDTARRALKERREDIQAARVQLAAAVTGNLAAYRHYALGQECVDRPSASGGWYAALVCLEHFRRALAADPSFALAHFQLAFLMAQEWGPQVELEDHLAAAQRNLAKLPAKEQGLVRALRSHVGGDGDAAVATLADVLATFPEDKDALAMASSLLYRRGSFAEAMPYIERLLALDPEAERVAMDAVGSMGALGRTAALGALADQLAAQPLTPARSKALVRALVWLGRRDEAVAVARRSVQVGGAAARTGLVNALNATARFEEEEALLRQGQPGQPEPVVKLGLATAVAGQGRRAEALRIIEEIGAALPPAEQGKIHFLRALHLLGSEDAAAAWREAAKAVAITPGSAAELAVPFALLGDLRHARQLAAGLRPGSPAEAQVRALAAWRGGDAVAAAGQLAALDARNPAPLEGMAPSYLLAEVSAAAGDAQETVSAVRRFHSLWPRGYAWSWTYPRSLLLLARAQVKLGHPKEARVTIEALLALWKNADPGLRLPREARALLARTGR